MAGAFEIVVAEALDRISRDQADIAALYKHPCFAGVMIFTLSAGEGEINELHVGLKGTMNALFLKDLAAKTHRGLRGRVEAGNSGGGICYGYDVVKLPDDAGEPIRGEREINEAEAKIVRRIFRKFAAGTSPRAIARRLNDDGIPGAKGRLWSDSVLRGHAKRGTGMLDNDLYIGRLVWNRQHFMKNPDTGKRVARVNPPEEWMVVEVPEPRIVGDGMPPALLVVRFDTRRGPEDRRRIALEDFCSILDLPTPAKYDSTIEHVARGLRPLSTDPVADLGIPFRRAALAWLIADGDMHLKNLALLGRHGGGRRSGGCPRDRARVAGRRAPEARWGRGLPPRLAARYGCR